MALAEIILLAATAGNSLAAFVEYRKVAKLNPTSAQMRLELKIIASSWCVNELLAVALYAGIKHFS